MRVYTQCLINWLERGNGATKIGHFGVKLSAMNEQSVINYSSRARELSSVNERGIYTKTS